MLKILGHPLFLYVVFAYLVFSLTSNFASAQDNPLPSCTGGYSTFDTCGAPNPLLAEQSQSNTCQANGGYTFKIQMCGTNPDRNQFRCYQRSNCSCPEGFTLNTTINAGNYTTECIEDDPGSGPICVPPEVDLGNGECGLPQCGEGYITQGHINGQPICQLDCTPYGGGSPGFFNGVEGCYGGEGPSCPQGTYWGQVNGVSGCWGDGSSGGSNSSSGGDSSSGGGSGSSSGGDGGGDGGGDNGGGGSGSGYEGAPYDPSEPCPSGYEKTENNTCEGQGDCYPGYHSVVISQSPFYAMCMPDELPPSSSSSSQSSSSPSSSNSSSQSSSPTGGGDSSSGGSGSSSGSGGGGNGDGEGPEFSGECDPTAANYMDCITPSGDMPAHTVTESGATTFAQVNQNFFNALSQTAPMIGLANMTGFIEFESPACPSFSIDLSDTIIGRVIATDLHCILWEDISGVLSVCMIGVWLWLGFRVFASA